MLRFIRTAISAGTFFGNIFFSGLPKIVEVHTTTGRRGKLWPADAGPEGGDYLSSCELEQFLEAQRKKYYQKMSRLKLLCAKNATFPKYYFVTESLLKYFKII